MNVQQYLIIHNHRYITVIRQTGQLLTRHTRTSWFPDGDHNLPASGEKLRFFMHTSTIRTVRLHSVKRVIHNDSDS